MNIVQAYQSIKYHASQGLTCCVWYNTKRQTYGVAKITPGSYPYISDDEVLIGLFNHIISMRFLRRLKDIAMEARESIK